MRFSRLFASLILALGCCGGGWLGQPANLSTSGAIVTGGLVAWYKLDDGSGTLSIDSSGNGHTGTNVNTPVWTDGQFAGALKFTGASSQKINCGNLGISSLPGFSVSFWFKRTAAGNIVSLGSSATAQEINIVAYSDGLVYFQLGDQSVGQYGTFSSNDTALHHFVGIFDGSQSGNAARLVVYFDNVKKTLSFTGTIPSTTPSGLTTFEIGHNTVSTYYSTGTIDDVRVYNRALTAAEAQSPQLFTHP